MSKVQEALSDEAEDTKFTRQHKNQLADLVTRGVDLQRKLAKVQEQLKEIKEQTLPLMRILAGKKQSEDFAVAGGVCKYKRDETLNFGKSFDPARDVLGKDWSAYFKEEIVIKPETRKLKELICDGDDPKGMALRNIATLDESESVSFKVN